MNIICLPFHLTQNIFSHIFPTKFRKVEINHKEVILGTLTYTSFSFLLYKIYQNFIYSKQYKITLYSANKVEKYTPNEEAFVKKGNKIFSKGKVIEFVTIGKFQNRYKIQFQDNTIYHVEPDHLIKIYPLNTILVCSDTHDYRRLAKTQINSNDTVLEIGSDFGYTTNIISQSTKSVYGIDKCGIRINSSQKEYPHIKFFHIDVLEEISQIPKFKMCNKVFIDINGNRELEQVERCLKLVKDIIDPELIVVKSVSFLEKCITLKLDKN